MSMVSIPCLLPMIKVLNDGTLLVAAAHSQPFGTGRQNLSQLFRISQDGEIFQRWPDEPADVIIKHFRFDKSQENLAVVLSRSADGNRLQPFPEQAFRFCRSRTSASGTLCGRALGAVLQQRQCGSL